MHHITTAVDQQGTRPGDARLLATADGSRTPAGMRGTRALTAGSRALARNPQSCGGKELPARWLVVSMAALGVLSVSAAVVSFAAQYRMVRAVKGSVMVSALEAGIPDVAALIFATLGIALALHGRRAIRARVLNVAAVGTSVGMNVLAAGHGWRNLAIWVMPPVAYAVASDTAIGVVRSWALARARSLSEVLAEDAATPLALVGGVLLWLLRLALAPASTLIGFRAWVIEECPVAPGRRAGGAAVSAAPAAAARSAASGGGAPRTTAASPRPGTKTRRFLDLVIERHGPLAGFPLAEVSRVCAELASQADLHPGAARAALRRHVQAARGGHSAQPAGTAPAASSAQNGSTS